MRRIVSDRYKGFYDTERFSNHRKQSWLLRMIFEDVDFECAILLLDLGFFAKEMFSNSMEILVVSENHCEMFDFFHTRSYCDQRWARVTKSSPDPNRPDQPDI